MNHSYDKISVPISSGINIVKSTSIRKAIMIEERSVGVNTVSSLASLAIRGEGPHEAKGVDVILGQKRSREILREFRDRRRRDGRDERMQEGSGGGGRGGGGGIGGGAFESEQNPEVGRGNDGEVVGGDEESELDLAFFVDGEE